MNISQISVFIKLSFAILLLGSFIFTGTAKADNSKFISHAKVRENLSKKKADTRKTANLSDVLKSYLDLTSFRTKVLSENLANLNTPGYKAQEVEAPKSAAELLEGHQKKSVDLVRTSSRHLSGSKNPAPKYRSNKLANPDEIKKNGNTVSLRQQMAKIAQNKNDYSAALKAYSTAASLHSTVLGNK